VLIESKIAVAEENGLEEEQESEERVGRMEGLEALGERRRELREMEGSRRCRNLASEDCGFFWGFLGGFFFGGQRTPYEANS